MNNLYAEKVENQVLGQIIMDAAIYISRLDADDFYIPGNKEIFKILQKIYDSGREPDVIIVAEELKTKKLNADALLTPVLSSSYLIVNMETCISTLKLYTSKRKALKQAKEMQDLVLNSEISTPEGIQEIITRLSDLQLKSTQDESHLMKTIAMQTYDHIMKTYSGDIKLLPTGIYDLDNMIGGLGAGEVFIIAARPGVGKTAFAIQLMLNMARSGVKTVMISREMKEVEICKRMVANLGGIAANKIRTAKYLTDSELGNVNKVCVRLTDYPIYINSSLSTVEDIKAFCRNLKNKEDIGCVIIDYLQLCTTAEKFQSREQIVSHMSRSFKEMAMTLRIPVIVLSQLNRASTREGREPNLSDLRESGAIEQDADCVMFMHQDKDKDKEEALKVEQLKLIVGKQRAGRTGNVDVIFEKDLMQIRNPADEELSQSEVQGMWHNK